MRLLRTIRVKIKRIVSFVSPTQTMFGKNNYQNARIPMNIPPILPQVQSATDGSFVQQVSKSSWAFVQYNMLNSTVFINQGARPTKSAQEVELEVVEHTVKYAISKDIMNAIFWTYCGALMEGFYENVAFVNIDLLPHMNKLKATCKKNDCVLQWKNREENVVSNMFVRSVAYYNMLY